MFNFFQAEIFKSKREIAFFTELLWIKNTIPLESWYVSFYTTRFLTLQNTTNLILNISLNFLWNPLMAYLSQCKKLNISITIKGFWISQLIENDVYVRYTSFGILVGSYFFNKNLDFIKIVCRTKYQR